MNLFLMSLIRGMGRHCVMYPAPPPLISVPPEPAQGNRGLPLLRLGFRPFYLAAASFGMLAVPLWVALYLGSLQLPLVLPMLLWHVHEMLFGFAVAVVIGFLLTAGKAWTGLETPRGALLGSLVLLWLGARVAALGGAYFLYAVLDVSLLVWVAALFTRLLWRARNLRNLPIALMLGLLALANVVFHLAVLGVITVPPLRALYGALALIVLMVSTIAGRVIPGFTMSATPGLRLVASAWRERITLGFTAAGLLGWACLPAMPLLGGMLWTAAGLHAVRQWHWRPAVTCQRPILWILHVAYAWLPLGLALLGAAQWGWISASYGLHALAVGTIGAMIMGMITRTARGHTGRPIQASRVEVLAYGLVLGAAATRVLLPLLLPQAFAIALVATASMWSLAFALYLLKFAPWLCAARLDGRDG